MRVESSKEDLTRGKHNRAVIVFVLNPPPRMHWQGLWASFAHHGDVVDSFILVKRSRDGNKFGFVRYSRLADAQRAISRLGLFTLFGSRISVGLAKYKVRNKYWKKVHTEKSAGKINRKTYKGSFSAVSTIV
ncbi:hypothetical protein V6N13_101118 [Hibiscus sabdariffa]